MDFLFFHFRFLLFLGILSDRGITPFGSLSSIWSILIGFPFLSEYIISCSIFGLLISCHICFCVFIVFFL